MKWQTIVLVLLLIAVLLVILEMVREVHTFKVTRYTIRPKKLYGLARNLNLVFLSDLHNRSYGEENERLIEAIRREEPDLILIGGDMLVGGGEVPCEAALALITSLTDLCPVIYANGNHEQRLKEDPGECEPAYREYREVLEESGVIFVENERLNIPAGRNSIKISGLELPMEAYQKFKKEDITPEQIEECLGFCPAREQEEGEYHILLAHNPTYMESYLEWGADLILSGHLHGGMVRVPGVGGAITPQGFFFPKYSGEMTQVGDQTVIVSRGLGTHTFHIRLLNQPEIVTVRLKKPL